MCTPLPHQHSPAGTVLKYRHFFSQSLNVMPAAARKTAVLKRNSVSTQIYNLLRESIISLELPPGTAIVRGDIAEQYGVSQTPVREALLKLEEEQLIRTFPQSKTEVSKIDLLRAQETQFLRVSLELEVSRRLCAQKAGMIAEAKTAITLQEQALEAGSLAAFTQQDKAFHQALFRAAGVQNLWQMITARSGHIDRLRNLHLPDPGKSLSILDCHRRILQAITAGDSAAAETVIREHLSGTLAKAEAIKQTCPQYF